MTPAAIPDESSALLRRYAEAGDEAAFGELVRRHLDHVYSVALRRVGGDAHMAQDVAQTVFTDLAHQVRDRRDGTASFAPLGGWLHRHACFVSSKQIRGEQRRRAREAVAAMDAPDQDDTDWTQLAPFVDDAVNELAAPDRDALLLRFYERRDLLAIGAALGVSDDAAQKRVSRALDKLREILGKRGVTSTSAALGLALGQHAVASAPAGFAAIFTNAALSAARTTTWSALMRSKLTLNKVGIAVAALATLGTLSVLQHRTNTRLRAELDLQSGELARLRSLSAKAPAEDHADELARLRAEHLELLRLRGQVAALRRERAEKQMSGTNSTAATGTADETPAAPPVQVEIETQFYELKEAALGELGVIPRLNQAITLTPQQTKDLLAVLGRRDDVRIVNAPKLVTVTERAANVSVKDEHDAVGPALEVTPHAEAGGRQLVLDLRLGYSATEKTDAAANGSPKVLPGQLVTVEDGQSVLLCQPTPPDALSGAGPRYLLALVTTTCLDPTGHRLFPQAPADPAATRQ